MKLTHTERVSNIKSLIDLNAQRSIEYPTVLDKIYYLLIQKNNPQITLIVLYADANVKMLQSGGEIYARAHK